MRALQDTEGPDGNLVIWQSRAIPQYLAEKTATASSGGGSLRLPTLKTLVLAYSTGQELNVMPHDLATRTANDWKDYSGMSESARESQYRNIATIAETPERRGRDAMTRVLPSSLPL